jgi:3'(2'), 5'-bisphosphate nucleotidase
MTNTLDILLDVAFDAARVVREVYETPFAVEWKGPRDPVTAADLRANRLICDRLSASFPGVPIVAEESAPESFANYRSAPRIFFVDPLDGTAEFIGRNGEFVVMIGLVEGEQATLGVVAAPAKGVAWAGSKDGGAWLVSSDGARTPIAVSRVTSPGDARVVASRSHRSPQLEELLGYVGARETVAVGSAGLKGAEIARGNADIYVGPGNVGKRWDACAVDALVTAAGGRFTDGFGKPFDYRAENLANETGLVATNGALHDHVLEQLAKLRR